jgi:formate hydrogenlyase subunit 6/NADH:ubiquinone oxidoreductase subunit I
MEQRTSYWTNITTSIDSLLTGLRLTFRHFRNARQSRKVLPIFDSAYFDRPDGIATIQYPHEILPVPVNGRYRLHNEIDDCIVCDKCAKVCPVNCITIEPIRAVEEIGKTSDGTSKRIYAATFDINMAQCCFCGLCTTVCPTECLTMTKVYDFSVTDIKEHTYAFAEMTPSEIEEKKTQFEEFQKSKAKPSMSTPGQPAENAITETFKTVAPRPIFKPKIKPPGPVPPPAS